MKVMNHYHLSIDKKGTLISRFGVSTFLIEYFDLVVNQPVSEILFNQIKKAQNQVSEIKLDGQSFPISIEPSEELYQITFLQKNSIKVA